MQISGFRLESELHQGQTSLVFRATRLIDNARVVIKALKNEFPTAQELVRYEREFQVSAPLKLQHTVHVLGLERAGHRSYLLYADDDSLSLRRAVGGRNLAVSQLLDYAIGIVRAVDELHRKKLLHNDINPANILVNLSTGEIKLTDLELASEPHAAQPATRALGTLNYIAPEQTGRTSAKPDYRSDLYSLGATLFELSTGRAVFTGVDDAGLLHAHLAIEAPNVAQINPAIPAVLCALIAKLLMKSPSDRYQSAAGLLDDLQRMQAQLQKTGQQSGQLDAFALGQSDHAFGLMQSDNLYGRDSVLAELDAAVEIASAASKPVWIALKGGAGSGKSSVMSSFAERLSAQRVLCQGRAERLEQSTPFSSLQHAFMRLLRYWLSLSEAHSSALRTELKQALGVNIAVLLPLLPELWKFVGAMPPLLPLGASAEQTRFVLATRAFMQVACRQQKPLILLLDDLQWADSATLNFLEKLLAGDLANCLLLSTERTELAIPQLAQWRERLRAAQVKEQALALLPLDATQLGRMVDDLLGEFVGGDAERASVVMVLAEKTLGNPFFARQLLKNLVQSEVLQPVTSGGSRMWRLDADKASELNYSENVLEFLGNGIALLPERQRLILEYAACIGQRFDFNTLSAVLENVGITLSPEDLAALVKAGMFANANRSVGAKDAEQNYRFIHERIREASLRERPEQERALMHLQIGRFWHDTQARGLFDVVNQLNRGVALLETDAEREMLARLNAKAAFESRAQTAYESALEYASFAVGLLPGDFQQREPAQTLEWYLLLADAQASAGQLKLAIDVFEHAKFMAESAVSKARVLERMCDALQSSGQPMQALSTVQEALKLLGHELLLPTAEQSEAFARMQQEQSALVAALCAPAALSTLAGLGNADVAAARLSGLYDKAIISVYFCRPDMLAFVTARSVQHVKKTGLTPQAGLAFAWWSMILCMLDKHAQATEYAEMARSTHARFGNDYYGGGAKMVATAMALSWTRPYAQVYADAGESAALLHQSGNLQFASYGLITQHIVTIVEASDCTLMLQSCERWADYCERYVPLELGQARIRRYCLKRMMGQMPEFLDCAAIVNEYAQQNNHTDVCESLTEMARLALITDDFASCLALCERAQPLFAAGAAGTLLLNFSNLVQLAISSARCARLAEGPEATRLATQFAAAAQRIEYLSTLHGDNFAGYQFLVQAEGAVLRDEFDLANSSYLAAIRHAQRMGYTLLQAQATQYLAELLRAHGLHFAHGVEADAQQLYRRAGCLIKVNESDTRPTRLSETTHASTSTGGAHSVDLLSVLKANEVIASEIDFDKLLLRLLSIAVENAGAQRGVLVLKQDDQFYVEADSREGRVHELLSHSNRCPEQMILYVARSSLATTMEDGPRRTAFREEPYFLRHATRSVLACPIVRLGTLRGVIYLENNSAAGVFGFQRVEMVSMLLGSAAIALENAELYRARQRYTEELEQRVSERTRALEHANQALARLADIDGLTQIPNRRNFDQRCAELAAVGAEVAFILCDVDDFKAYNDHYGHPAGDEVLRKIGACLASLALPFAARALGLVARYGGEEFVIVLPDTDAQAALRCAEIANQAVYALALPHTQARAAPQVTMSLGIAHTLRLHPGKIESLINAADGALYQAKNAGRNRAHLSI